MDIILIAVTAALFGSLITFALTKAFTKPVKPEVIEKTIEKVIEKIIKEPTPAPIVNVLTPSEAIKERVKGLRPSHTKLKIVDMRGLVEAKLNAKKEA